MSAIILGWAMLVLVIIKYYKNHKIGTAGWFLLFFGVTLIGLPFFKEVKIRSGVTEITFTLLGNNVKAIVNTPTWKVIKPNTKQFSNQDGYVVVALSASGQYKNVFASGFIGEKQIVNSAAEYNTNDLKSSTLSNLFVMPVNKGNRWHIKVDTKHESLVKIKWVSYGKEEQGELAPMHPASGEPPRN